MSRAQLIEAILGAVEPLRDMTRFRAWLEDLETHQLQEWATALPDL
jgi:hypothetical protein